MTSSRSFAWKARLARGLPEMFHHASGIIFDVNAAKRLVRGAPREVGEFSVADVEPRPELLRAPDVDVEFPGIVATLRTPRGEVEILVDGNTRAAKARAAGRSAIPAVRLTWAETKRITGLREGDLT